MGDKKCKGPVFDLGMCRCCGSLKRCRLLNVEYDSLGQKEVYSDMMMDCFGLLLSHLDGKDSERLVCATCVVRLREAHVFRGQVLRCEEAFLQMKMYDGEDDETKPGKEQKVDIESVKVEVELEDLGSPAEDALARSEDGDSAIDNEPGTVKAEEDMSEDDLPIAQHKRNLTEKRKEPNEPSGSGSGVKKMKTEEKRKKIATKPVPSEKTMTRLQQINRERDVNYILETNILTLVEFSYICPFKCRHNNLLCYYCGHHCSNAVVLREHTLKEHHPKKFKVNEHKKMIKIDITRIDCRLCDRRIDSIDEFKEHISKEHNKKFYFNQKDAILPFKLTQDEVKCVLCPAKFLYFHALNKHMNVHFSNYVCETCGLGFVDKCRFVMHQQRHDEGDFPCGTCGKAFRAQYNRDLHVDRVHNKKGRVYCPKCDEKLMSYPQKLKHLVEVHGEPPLRFPCALCDRVCLTRRMLTIHRRKDHLRDYRYECQCCGQRFFTRFALNNHMPTHTGERNYKCKVTHPETELSDKLVCATCVMRLREAAAFRQQIISCEASLIERQDEAISSFKEKEEIEEDEEEGESVRNEVMLVDVDRSDDGRDYDDDVSDPEYKPEPDSPPKRKTTRTPKKSPKTPKSKKKLDTTVPPGLRRSTNQYTSGQESAELKQLLLARLHKLKALAGPAPHPATHLQNRPRRHKDLLIFENTVKIVESSYVCPFNNIIGTFHCYYCKSAFIKPEELREHTMDNHNPKEFPKLWPKMKAIKIDISRVDCRLCDTKISDIDELKNHLTEAHEITFHDLKNEFLKFKICEDNLICLECGASYLFIDKLIEHMAIHFGTHVCDYCGAGFVQLSSLIAHVRGHKTAAKDYPCPVCFKNLRTARSRWQHMMVVHEKKPVIKCIKCTETFLSYERRDIHLRDEHGDARSYPCRECGKVFDIRRRYMSHVKSVHLKSYKLQCQLCERRFCKPRDLKNHVQTHGVRDVNVE